MGKRSSGREASAKKSERRDTPRIPIALDTVLHYNNQSFRHSLTRDISLDGAFVETREALTKKGSLELAISLPTDGKPQFHRFQAQVVRVADGGAGLMFDKVGTEAYAALLDLVFSRQGRGLW